MTNQTFNINNHPEFPKKMYGYKVFHPDWTCGERAGRYFYDYKNGEGIAVGTTHVHEGAIEVCGSGFHFCEKISDCFSYYSFDPANKVALVEAEGYTDNKEDSKRACVKLSIVREIEWMEVLSLANTGNRNTGYWNTGNRNTGDWNAGNSNTGDSNTGNRNTGDWNAGNSNTGDRNTGNSNTGDRNAGYWNTGNRNTGDWNTGNRNTGDWNTGNRNTGDWNTANYQTGFFNTTEEDVIRIFNKNVSRKAWDEAYKPDFLYFDLTYWCEEENKTKSYEYKEAFKKSWENADTQDRMRIKDLPNFDEDVFFEISGIRVSDYE